MLYIVYWLLYSIYNIQHKYTIQERTTAYISPIKINIKNILKLIPPPLNPLSYYLFPPFNVFFFPFHTLPGFTSLPFIPFLVALF